MLYEADANAKLAHWTEATWADSDQQILAVAANTIWDCIHEQYVFKVDGMKDGPIHQVWEINE